MSPSSIQFLGMPEENSTSGKLPGLTEKSGKVGLCRPRLLSEAGQASSFPLEKPVENEENRGFRWESEPREDRREGGRDSGEQVSVRVRGERFVNAW